MLHEFLSANRQTLISRCSDKVAKRKTARQRDVQLEHGIPLFLEQLVRTLQLDHTANRLESVRVSGPAEPAKTPVLSEIGKTAAKHGKELLRQGCTIDQVVHAYGDLCQAISELAAECHAPVTIDEFKTLNRCLDNAIADATTEFSRERDTVMSSDAAHAMGTRLSYLAHDLRNLLDCAMVAVAGIKSGEVGIAGATGGLLDRSLSGLRDVIDRSLADVRLSVGMPAHHEPIAVAGFIEEIQVAGHLHANARGCTFTVPPVDNELAVHADRQMLSSALANVLRNAFEFSAPHGHVSLKAYAAEARLLIEVADACGGLPQDIAEPLSRPYAQGGDHRTGLGGLAIAQRSVEATGGILHARDVPGTGCIFTIDLPLRPHYAQGSGGDK
jgi:signal transduction histidine kinase